MKKKGSVGGLCGVLYPILSLVVAIAIWFVVAAAIDVEFLLPSPVSTIKKLFYLTGQSRFYLGLLNTTLHAVLSFIAAFVAAAVFAVLAGMSKTFERLLSPVVLVVRVAPTMSVIFIAMLWISSEKSPYLVCVFILFPMLYSRILSAIRSVDPELKEMAAVYRVGKMKVVRWLYLPHVSRSVADECPGILSFAIKLAVSGEAVVQSGMTIGSLMYSAKVNFDTAELIAYTFAAIVLGFLLEILCKAAIALFGRIRHAKTCRNR